jgi:hypothetical protein
MRLNMFRLLAAMAAAVFFTVSGSASVQAQEMQFVSVTAFNEVQNRLDDLEFRLASMGDNGKNGNGCDSKTDCCDPVTSCCCTTRGFTGMAELLALRAFESEGAAETTSYNVAYRLTAGWTGDRGLGVRVRWFDYSTDTNIEDFNLYGVDAEVTGNFKLGCNWNGLLALGARHSKFEEVGDVKFYGWGPSVAAELRRNLRNNIDLFGSARYAILIGENQQDNYDGCMSYGELQVGAEWHRHLCGTTTLFVRGALEAQLWSGQANDDTQDLALFGGNFGIGIAR